MMYIKNMLLKKTKTKKLSYSHVCKHIDKKIKTLYHQL